MDRFYKKSTADFYTLVFLLLLSILTITLDYKYNQITYIRSIITDLIVYPIDQLSSMPKSLLNDAIRESSNLDELEKIVSENNVHVIVFGNPKNMDGTEGSSSQSVKDKAKLISEKIKIPIFMWDERLSTVGAFNLSSQLDVNVTKRVKNIDENAATFILQGVLDFLNN